MDDWSEKRFSEGLSLPQKFFGDASWYRNKRVFVVVSLLLLLFFVIKLLLLSGSIHFTEHSDYHASLHSTFRLSGGEILDVEERVSGFSMSSENPEHIRIRGFSKLFPDGETLSEFSLTDVSLISAADRSELYQFEFATETSLVFVSSPSVLRKALSFSDGRFAPFIFSYQAKGALRQNDSIQRRELRFPLYSLPDLEVVKSSLEIHLDDTIHPDVVDVSLIDESGRKRSLETIEYKIYPEVIKSMHGGGQVLISRRHDPANNEGIIYLGNINVPLGETLFLQLTYPG